MGIKLNTREGILTARGGGYSAALLYDLGVIVRTDAGREDEILAFYSETKRGWIIGKRPHYSSGGWGSGSSGDHKGYYLNSLASSLLKAIDARTFKVNVTDIRALKSPGELYRQAAEAKKLKAALAKIGVDAADHELADKQLNVELKEKGESPRGIDPAVFYSKMKEAAAAFIDGTLKKSIDVEGYRITPSKVSVIVNSVPVTVAFKAKDGSIVMNSQALPVTSFECRVLGGQSVIQKTIRTKADLSIPFNVLEAAELDLRDTKVIDAGPEETHRIGGVERHFTGALLLENNGRKFLMDLDRREIGFGIWNVFFCEVNSEVESIAGAYDSMMPEAVKTALAEGRKVERQGEFFFIKTDKTLECTGAEISAYEREGDTEKYRVTGKLISHGKGRPNSVLAPTAPELSGLFCGVVSHTGREHRDLSLGMSVNGKEELKRWFNDDDTVIFDLWECHPNTTVGNFTIQGDVD